MNTELDKAIRKLNKKKDRIRALKLRLESCQEYSDRAGARMKNAMDRAEELEEANTMLRKQLAEAGREIAFLKNWVEHLGIYR